MIESARPNQALAGLKAYDPGHDLVALRAKAGAQALSELGSNENPWGPSPQARAAAVSSLSAAHVYPDPGGRGLKQALAEHYQLQPQQFTLGNGSHELLMLLAQAFVNPGEPVVYSQFGFAVFALATQAANGRAVVVPALPLNATQLRGHDLDAMLAAIEDSTRLVYVANPNNPTGTWFSQSELQAFLRRVPARTLVVLDEAYFEYADPTRVADAAGLLAAFDNLVVTRTFSKGYGLAGLRVGYAMSHPDVASVLERLRESFNVNCAALAAAQAALGAQQWVRDSVAECVAEREHLHHAIQTLGWHVTTSQTNFLLVDFARPAAPIEAQLFAQGVIVRPMGGYGLPTCLRITVGSPADNARLLAALGSVK